MNQLSVEKQQAILSRLERGTSIRSIAEFEGVARGTVRRLRKLPVELLQKKKEYYRFIYTGNNKKASESQRLRRMREYFNLKPITNPILPCGKTLKDCVNCRDIFSENCGFTDKSLIHYS